ncbi:MAG: zinc-binding dehydrogenase [Anaerolineae bacterium]|nr:zinc-binding dehydrogenase [Anaerolineae bacterium]
MTYEQASSIPEAFITAYANLILMAELKEAETVLIHAGASGVGLAAIQLARLIGTRVIVTASAFKHDICYINGANMAIDYKTENFADKILADSRGVNVIMDMVGAPYWEDNFRVIEKWGRWVFIGTQGGNKVELNINQLMSKRLRLMGSTLRDRTTDEKSHLIADFEGWAMPHFVGGALKATIHTIMDWEDVEKAHEMMRENHNAGKIILRVK